MKILLLSGLYPKDDEKFGGIFVAERYKHLSRLCEIDLYKVGYKPTVFYKTLLKKIFRKNVKEDTDLLVDNVQWKNINLKKSILLMIFKIINEKLYLLFNIRSLRKQLDFKKYDLIHVHWVYPTGYMVMVISKIFNIPYVVTAHGSDIHTVPKHNKRNLKKTLEVLENADHVIFVSEYLRNEAIKLGYKNRNSSVIYNGVNLEKFIFQDSRCKGNKSVITYIGRLEEIKGADRIPKIFNIISSSIENVEFNIVGSGSLEESINNKLKHLNYKHYKYLTHEKLSIILNKSDIVIVPSRNESFCCVIIEAQSCGCKVVATNVGGIPESLGGFGRLVDECKNYENYFAQNVIEFLGVSLDMSGMIERSKNFSWKNTVNQEYLLYMNLLG